MKLSKIVVIGVYSGLISTIIGLVVFSISWNFWAFFDGPLPGYKLFLFPGNLTLIYFWHPLFTEEVSFWSKLAMLLFGQFVVVTSIVTLLVQIKNSCFLLLRRYF